MTEYDPRALIERARHIRTRLTGSYEGADPVEVSDLIGGLASALESRLPTEDDREALIQAFHGDQCPDDPDEGEACQCGWGDFERMADIALGVLRRSPVPPDPGQKRLLVAHHVDRGYWEDDQGDKWVPFAPVPPETDEAVVNRVARAIFDVRDDEFDMDEWEDLGSVDRERYLCDARAALAAVPPVTEETEWEYGLWIEGVRDGKLFREFSHQPNGLAAAEEHARHLRSQTGLPDWQPNITSVEVVRRPTGPWVPVSEGGESNG